MVYNALYFHMSWDLLHLIENKFDRKRIYANPSSYPNPKAQLRFRTDEMTSFFDQV